MAFGWNTAALVFFRHMPVGPIFARCAVQKVLCTMKRFPFPNPPFFPPRTKTTLLLFLGKTMLPQLTHAPTGNPVPPATPTTLPHPEEGPLGPDTGQPQADTIRRTPHPEGRERSDRQFAQRTTRAACASGSGELRPLGTPPNPPPREGVLRPNARERSEQGRHSRLTEFPLGKSAFLLVWSVLLP